MASLEFSKSKTQLPGSTPNFYRKAQDPPVYHEEATKHECKTWPRKKADGNKLAVTARAMEGKITVFLNPV